MDTGLHALIALARFHRLPAESEQLAHQFGTPGQPFTDTELLLAAKALTLKAKVLKPSLLALNNAMLPAVAKTRDGHYVILARLSSDNVASDISAASNSKDTTPGVLIHDLREDAPRTLSLDDQDHSERARQADSAAGKSGGQTHFGKGGRLCPRGATPH